MPKSAAPVVLNSNEGVEKEAPVGFHRVRHSFRSAGPDVIRATRAKGFGISNPRKNLH
jgi:hypothetical protein